MEYPHKLKLAEVDVFADEVVFLGVKGAIQVLLKTFYCKYYGTLYLKFDLDYNMLQRFCYSVA